MRGLVEAGWAAREAARRVIEEPAAAVAVLPRSDGDATVAVLDELAARGEDFDVVRLERLLDRAFAVDDPVEAVDEWLMPSLARLGTAWQRGAVTVAGEHFVSAAVLRRLSFAFDQLPHPAQDSPQALVGLARGSRHELGVMAFAMVLRSRGVAVTYLGADLPVESWVDTVRALQPHAVVLGVPTVEDLPAVREAVQALSGAPGCSSEEHTRTGSTGPSGWVTDRVPQPVELARRLSADDLTT